MAQRPSLSHNHVQAARRRISRQIIVLFGRLLIGTGELEVVIRSYLDLNNRRPKPFAWTKPPTNPRFARPFFVNVFLTQDPSVMPLK